jgi:TolA-binding protein
MTVMNIVKPAAAMALASMLTLAAPASAQMAQGSVTTTDIQRLQDQVYDAGNEVSRLRSRDQATADRLQAQLDDLRDEVVYLKVKLRKEGSVNRSDYNDVRRHVDTVRSEARGISMATTDNVKEGRATFPAATTNGGTGYGTGSGSGTGTSGSGGVYGGTTDAQNPNDSNAPVRRNEVPSGQEIDVRLERPLSSDTAQVEDRFTATTMVDLYQGNDVLIPAGSTLRGVVSSVNKATRTDRKGTLTVAFDQITVRSRSYPIHGTVTQALESEGIKGEAVKIGAGAGVGAIIGGILGGAKGALLGVLIGGGGTIAATDGKDVTLAAGSVLRVRFDQPLQIR